MAAKSSPAASATPYTVLARKYRSRTFDEVVGQEPIAQTLKKAIETGRVHHAYLFTGTRGVGKTSMARILAVALNDPTAQGPTPTPNPDTDTARAIFRGEDVDVIEIDAASNTGVENVRDLIENARYRPMHSRHKIYIIDEVHMLSKSAFNALLKIMEEPPEHVKFILATTEPEKVLPTILSRVQRFDFRNIPAAEIAGHLRAVCKQEGIKAEDDALRLVARNGAGSMRDALSLLDRLASGLEPGETLTTDKVTALLGLPPMQRVFELVEAIGEGDAKEALARAHALLSAGQSADSLIGALIDHLHALLVRNLAGGGELSELPGLEDSAVAAQSAKFEPAVLSQDIAILEELRRQTRSSAAGRALLDATLVRLALAEQFVPISELLSAADGEAPAGSAPRAEKKTPLAAAGGDSGRRQGLQPVLRTVATDSAAAEGSSETPLLRAAERESALLQDEPALEAASPAGRGSGETPLLRETPPDLAGLFARLRNVLQVNRQGLNALLEGGWIERIDLPASAEEAGAVEIAFDAAQGPLVSILERNTKKEQVAVELGQLLGLPRPPHLHLRLIGSEGVSVDASAEASPGGIQRRGGASSQANTSAGSRPSGQIGASSTPARLQSAAEALESAQRESPPQPISSVSDIDVEAEPLLATAIRELGARIVKVEEQ